MNKHKAKCDVLKKIRKGIADKLGIDLHQRECTFEGECKGTCPKCKQEEDILNRELTRRAGALALGATASLMLTACAPGDAKDLRSDITPEITDVDGGLVAGNLMPSEDELPEALMGEPLLPDEFVTAGQPAIDGDIIYEEEVPESEEAEDNEQESVLTPEATTGVPLYDGED